MYIGVNNSPKKVNNMYIGVNNSPKKIISGYVGGPDGKPKLIFPFRLGEVITWDDKEWLVCNYNSSTNQADLLLNSIPSTTQFDSNGVNYYVNSGLAEDCLDFYNNYISASAKSQIVMIPTTEGAPYLTKVIVPTAEMLSGTAPNGILSWFANNDNARRIALFNNKPTEYWTSTTEKIGTKYYAKTVSSTGTFSSKEQTTKLIGFRPLVRIQIS